MCWDVFAQRHDGFHTGTLFMCDFRASCFTLDRFSHDQIRAIFKCGEDSAGRGSLFRRLHEKQLVNTRIFSDQVRKVVNGTGLPELQIDDEKQEISLTGEACSTNLWGKSTCSIPFYHNV